MRKTLTDTERLERRRALRRAYYYKTKERMNRDRCLLYHKNKDKKNNQEDITTGSVTGTFRKTDDGIVLQIQIGDLNKTLVIDKNN